MNNQNFAFCRGCGRQILWTRMKTGKSMPCDPEVIRFSIGGSEAFVTPRGDVLMGSRNQDGGYIGYVSHFATCRDADRFRKGRA